uniref:Neurocan core protein n=1 Tax=Magallana gigas TaxID=29159 RepID=K1RUR6_MAGGI
MAKWGQPDNYLDEDCVARNEAFKDLLPIHGDVNYIYTKNDLSMFECAGSCKFCAGFLYNSGSKTCHLLKSLLNETIFNRSRVDIGWELYESLNVCGSGWYLYRTHCYTYLDLKKTMADAKDYCASIGAYLVQIDTRDENEWIKRTLQPALKETCSNTYCCDTWIGATDQVEENMFQWTNKENVVFSNWISGQPDDYGGNEDCAALCLNENHLSRKHRKRRVGCSVDLDSDFVHEMKVIYNKPSA